MFTYTLLDSKPWEQGIKPDAENEHASVWVEKEFTQELRMDVVNNEPIESLQLAYVALCRFSDGTVAWIIADEHGAFDTADNIDSLCGKIDQWKLIHQFR